MKNALGTIITRTPFRLNFFGGGTDFPDYFNKHRGAVLGTTINKYTYVTINSLERLLEKKIRMSYSKLEMVDDASELEHSLARCVLTKNRDLFGNVFLDIHSYADLPAGTGIGSSSAFTVGFLNALYLLHKKFRSPREIAEEAIIVERNLLKQAGGWQDQIHSSFGGFNRIDFQSGQFVVTPVCLSSEKYAALENSCMFFFTGITRSSSVVHSNSDIETSTADKEPYLNFIYKMVDQAFQILHESTSNQEMLENFGALLEQCWQSKKKLSSSVSNQTIDEIYNAAKDAGAFGGKLLGAGAGGFMAFIVPPEKKEAVASALSKLHQVQIKFERYGSRAIFAD